MTNKKICVFCGSSKGKDPIYTKIAQQLAQLFLKEKITLVYGGAKVGLMGEMADFIMNGGGQVIGVIPQFLVEREVMHTHITKLHIVESMSERKNLFNELSDAFILIPGGIGSLDEFFEVITLAQLNRHDKPSAILNVAHYYDDLIKFLKHSVNEGFWNSHHYNRLIIEKNPESLMDALAEMSTTTF